MWKALPLAAAAIVLTATAAGGSIMRPAGQAASGAFEISQTLGKGDTLRLVVSEQGSSATETRNKTRSGVVVRYEDGQVFSLDYAKKGYSAQSVGATYATSGLTVVRTHQLDEDRDWTSVLLKRP